MKSYRILHRPTHAYRVVRADTAQDACEMCGWVIGDCFVEEKKQ